jgi:CO/xanthine dehydrogenase FAD-binding subunit
VTATDATATTADVPCVRPRTLAEALAARATHPDWLVVAGGTDLMVGALHRAPPAGVIDVFGIRELQGIHRLELKVRIGAGTTYAKLLEHTLVSRVLPSLHQACAEVGAVQIQARGTLGGNMATSSPVGDTLPCLLALDATVVLVSATNGERRVPYHAFCTGYRKVDLREDELISKVMLAATGYVDAAGRISRARVALGAVADRPLRLRAVEALLLGQRPDEALAARAHDAVCAAITPITDVRSTKEYRLDVAARLVAGFVRTLEERAGP